jgi:hypothetical protein
MGKPTKQMSNHTEFTPPKLAVDGSTDNEWSKCTQTKRNDDKPWWRVDMKDEFVLFKVKLYNRNCEGDCGKCMYTTTAWKTVHFN